jgi:sarcosine oxidase subunit gamma
MTTPTDFACRSPVYRRMVARALAFVPFGDSAVAVSASAPTRDALCLVDLSVLPRWGLKGSDVFPWLAARGAAVRAEEQTAIRQADGSLIARLAPSEALVLSSIRDGACEIGTAIERIPAAGDGRCYPVPRCDSHCWFAVRGAQAVPMFAKVCGVDLAPGRFADCRIAQTSVARLSSIIIRNDLSGELAFSILTESASAEYLWDCLLDAMEEFGGEVAGADRLGLAVSVPGATED